MIRIPSIQAVRTGTELYCHRFFRATPVFGFKPIWPTQNTMPEPEDEILKMKLTDSFEQRMAKARPPEPVWTDVGRTVKRMDTKEIELAQKSKLISADSDTDTGAELSLSDQQDLYNKTMRPKIDLNIAMHYGIYEHLFNSHTLYYSCPEVDLRVGYAVDDEETVTGVYTGNKLLPSECSDPPLVGFQSIADGKKYSLLMINLDGHLTDSRGEYLHWFCANMTGGTGIESGESCTYLQPIPLRGTGYHRYVFVLLEHESNINMQSLPVIKDSDLSSRSFKFSEFYREINNTNQVTPVGMQFFQTEWDPTVRVVFHKILDMEEPGYKYDKAKSYVRPQAEYPQEEPFNKYLDRYRDPRDKKEEVLKEFLAETNPFLPPDDQGHPFPLAKPTKPGLYYKDLPATWIQERTQDKVNRSKNWSHIFSDH